LQRLLVSFLPTSCLPLRVANNLCCRVTLLPLLAAIQNGGSGVKLVTGGDDEAKQEKKSKHPRAAVRSLRLVRLCGRRWRRAATAADSCGHRAFSNRARAFVR